MTVIYNKVALIGLGLIASSMALAMKRGGLATTITGYARSQETRDIARELNLCEVFDTAAEAVQGADLVVLCVPVGAMAAVMADIGPALKPGATLSDVGSVKKAVIEVRPCLWQTGERIFDRLGQRRLAGDFTQLLFEPNL